MIDDTSPAATKSGSITVSHLFGEITWLLSQSPLHRHFTLADLEWLVMPPLLHRQFHIFYDDGKPVGLATWARCNEGATAKLRNGVLDPDHRLTLDEWASGDDVWLVDLVAPFGTAENRHNEIMLADLICGPLAGQAFTFHETDAVTGRRSERIMSADAGERLRESIMQASS